jgi:hypothetical protein
MNNAPYQGVANNLAQYGRYGDSQLVHMNPIEVQGLAALSPTGQLTTNPVTGQPEAFLPFLAPILGSFLGNAALGSTLAGALGSKALGAAAAGALGSAAATTAVTGDLEQGILSGITGFAMGSALGNLPGAGAGEVAQAAQAAQGITPEAIAPEILASPTAIADAASTSAVNPAIARELGGTFGGTELMGMAPTMGQVGATGIAPAIEAAAPQLGQVAAAEPTFMQRLTQPFQDPGALLGEMTKPGVAIPAYIGMGTSAQLRAQQEAEEGFRRQQEEGDAQRRADLMRTQSQMAGVFNQLRRDYPGIGYAQGGKVEGYFNGGDIENQIYNALLNSPYAGIPSAEETQLSLRGTELVAPPAASYSALDVGGEGYLPGISPEFTYFRNPPPPPPAATDPGSLPGGGNVVGGPGDFMDPNFDWSSFLGGSRGYRNYLDLFGGGSGMPQMPGTSTDFITPSMERDVFAGGTPGFYDQDFFEITLDQFDPSRFQEYLNSQVTPEAIQNQMNAVPAMGVPPAAGQPFMPPAMNNIPSPISQLPPGTMDSYGPIEMPQEGIGAFMEMPQQQMQPQVPFEVPQIPEISQMSTEELMELSRLMQQGGFNALPFQEGGMVPEPGQLMEEMAPVDEMGAMQGEYEQLINMTIAAIRGEVEDPQAVIRAFVEEFGNDAFMQLREAVLQEVVPGAQTEGMVEGMGGGQDDMVPGMIGTQRPVAVSPGEYIIPADVVAMAGGGYSGNGADFFDGLIDDIRMKTMGTTEQVRPYQ